MLLVFNWRLWCALAGLFFLGLVGCRTSSSSGTSAYSHGRDQLAQAPEPLSQETPDANNPRAQASLELTKQGIEQYQQGQVDDAMNTFERAASLFPGNGENYYWLAEAWLHKGNAEQALEYHRLARRHLSRESTWGDRLQTQQDSIGQ